MNKSILKLVLLIVGIILYDFLFWKSYWGVNALLFALFLLACLLMVDAAILKRRVGVFTLAGTFIASVLAVTHNSITSIFALLASFTVLLGFYFQPELRSVIAALPTGFFNFFAAPFHIRSEALISEAATSKKITNVLWNILRLSILPVCVCLIFYWIYRGANPVFDRIAGNVEQNILDFFNHFFEKISWSRFFFILLGLLILTGALFNGNIRRFMIWDNKSQDALEINPNQLVNEQYRVFPLGDEYRIGLILMGIINVLILIVNIIDINWLWLGFEFQEGMNLSQLVHEGTSLLILSILLSMAIILFFFRGKLNYYQNGKWLQYFAYTWILQNSIMVVSVAIRNYHYMYHYGLAYKRIGVFIFLALTLIGIITLVIKIRQRKSAYFLLRINSWSVYCMMLFISFFNWDIIIANHNLHHRFRENIDVHFLLTLSDKTLHLIEQNQDILDKTEGKGFWRGSAPATYREYFNYRKSKFLERKQQESWVSWNYPEDITLKFFSHQKNNSYEGDSNITD